LFYRKFENIFGKAACSYNIHVFSHLTRVRQLGPLTSTSAFAFEDLYGLLQRCYQSGTTSTGKQAFQNYFLKKLSSHQCEKNISFSSKQTAKQNDQLILTNEKKWYKIVKILTDSKYLAVEIKTQVFKKKLEKTQITLDFSLVGVWTCEKVTYDVETYISLDCIIAKGILVNKLLIEVPLKVLRE
jgi:hypothetical protein